MYTKNRAEKSEIACVFYRAGLSSTKDVKSEVTVLETTPSPLSSPPILKEKSQELRSVSPFPLPRNLINPQPS